MLKLSQQASNTIIKKAKTEANKMISQDDIKNKIYIVYTALKDSKTKTLNKNELYKLLYIKHKKVLTYDESVGYHEVGHALAAFGQTLFHI